MRAEKTIVVAPNSFKGSLSASAAAEAMERGVRRARPKNEVACRPMADGGEGTVEALVAGGGERRSVAVRNACGKPTKAVCGWLEDSLYVIETAQIVGLTSEANRRVDVARRTTLGLGDAVRAGLAAGARRIVVGLGGSVTNDGGAGLLAVLGARLLDAEGHELEAEPACFDRLARVDLTGLDERLRAVKLIGLSDVNSPLTGERGATAVFGPQKGVAADEIASFDRRLARFADCVEVAFGRRLRDLPGSGAAGGLGFALSALGGELRSGAEAIADAVGLDQVLAKAAVVLTGEGASDRQTLCGKAPFVVAKRARHARVPAVLIAGAVEPESLAALDEHFLVCLSCVPGPVSLEQAVERAALYVENAANEAMRLFFA